MISHPLGRACVSVCLWRVVENRRRSSSKFSFLQRAPPRPPCPTAPPPPTRDGRAPRIVPAVFLSADAERCFFFLAQTTLYRAAGANAIPSKSNSRLWFFFFFLLCFSQEKRILKTGEHTTQQENQNISAATMKVLTDSFSSEKVSTDDFFFSSRRLFDRSALNRFRSIQRPKRRFWDGTMSFDTSCLWELIFYLATYTRFLFVFSI